jgi:hypothetical protein
MGLRQRLVDGPDWLFASVAASSSFSCYFCMYAFRRPFTAASFEGRNFYGITFKTALVLAQLFGYTISKFLGMKFCTSSFVTSRRGLSLIALILVAELALLLFAVLPGGWKVAAMFLNGIPLGMVWGLVVGYLEGRTTSELLLAALSCAFIISSAVVKDVGLVLLDYSISEFWMPFMTGLIFFVPFVISVWLLEQLPKPSATDIVQRSERTAMDSTQRWAFVRTFSSSLVPLIVFYMGLTAFRDYRDNFAVELFTEMGYDAEPSVFSRSETGVAAGVMVAMATLNVFKDNRTGLYACFAVMVTGAAMVGAATYLMRVGAIDGLGWMVSILLIGTHSVTHCISQVQLQIEIHTTPDFCLCRCLHSTGLLMARL